MNKQILSSYLYSSSLAIARGDYSSQSTEVWEVLNLQDSMKSNETVSQSSSSDSQKFLSSRICADENLLGGNDKNPRKISDSLSQQNDQQPINTLNELETAQINPRKNTPPSTINPRKNRRRKGEGSGSIYYRRVTKHGKEYQEAYYHWCENGKKRTKYIPKKLLNRVQEAEALKLPVSDIVNLLGGNNKSPRKSSDILSQQNDEQLITSLNGLDTSQINPRKNIPPSKKRRRQGYGGGYIECKPIKRNGKVYKQYWYHYEFWEKGDLIVKKCRYIQKHLLVRVQKLEAEKAPVRDILKLLGVIRS